MSKKGKNLSVLSAIKKKLPNKPKKKPKRRVTNAYGVKDLMWNIGKINFPEWDGHP